MRNRASSRIASVLALAAAVLGPLPARAQAPVVVKMATLAPEGSSWHNILKEMAEKWRVASGGRVTLRLFPGGVAGDDADVVRKMRLQTLHAGLLTSVGLGEVDRSVYALGVPMMYASNEELDYVLEKMTPRLTAGLEAKGFVVLNWADAGWVRFFTKEAAPRPDDLKKLKLFSWQGDADSVEVWKAAGFHPIPLASTDISTSLQTGLITALPSPPQAAVVMQWYTHATHMTDVRWQLLLGATVISKRTWEQIPADLRPALLQAAREAGQKLRAEVRAGDDRDVEAMRKRGLDVVKPDAQALALWRSTAEAAYPQVRGKIVPADAFDEALRWRDEYRKTHGGR